jgi:formylglycine-generating enzyme required for sulfatase activity
MKIRKKFLISIGAFAVAALFSTSTVWAGDAPDDMALIPGGSFLMGVDKTVQVNTEKMTTRQRLKYAVSREAFHDEGPAHMVITDPYYMDKHEVSNKQYSEFIKATGHPAPAYWDDRQTNVFLQKPSGKKLQGDPKALNIPGVMTLTQPKPTLVESRNTRQMSVPILKEKALTACTTWQAMFSSG